MKNARKFLLLVILFVTPIVTVMAAGELLLRAAPELIGLSLLDRFPKEIKSRVAARLGLPNQFDHNVIRSAERHFPGPDIYLPKPNSRYQQLMQAEDVNVGATEDVRVDDFGFCNTTPVLGQYDIVVVGGSIPNCIGVLSKDTFPAMVGQMLGRSAYNLTLNGGGPFEYDEILSRELARLKPRLVIMMFAEANDLWDCRKSQEFAAGKASSTRYDKEWPWPFTSSLALSFIKAGMEVGIKSLRAKGQPDFTYSVATREGRVNLNVGNRDTYELDDAKSLSAGQLSPNVCEPALKAFLELSRQYHFKPAVMPIPAPYNLYYQSVAFKDPAFRELMSEYGAAQRSWLSTQSGTLGFELIDAYGVLSAEASRSELLYFPVNNHPTVAGHRNFAKRAVPMVKLILENLLPKQ